MSDIWRNLFRQMETLGKLMVEDDIHDVGSFKYYDREGRMDHPSQFHHWQLGVAIWYASKILSLANFFFPFDKQLERKALENRINQLKELEKLTNARPKVAQDHQRDSFRGIRRKRSRLDGSAF